MKTDHVERPFSDLRSFATTSSQLFEYLEFDFELDEPVTHDPTFGKGKNPQTEIPRDSDKL